jgi:hypothetical protein
MACGQACLPEYTSHFNGMWAGLPARIHFTLQWPAGRLACQNTLHTSMACGQACLPEYTSHFNGMWAGLPARIHFTLQWHVGRLACQNTFHTSMACGQACLPEYTSHFNGMWAGRQERQFLHAGTTNWFGFEIASCWREGAIHMLSKIEQLIFYWLQSPLSAPGPPA